MKHIILCLFFFTCTARGMTIPEPGGYAIAAEWLGLISAIDQPYFAISSNSPIVINGERFAAEQAWHKGYRVEALHRFCNGSTDICLRWTHIPRFREENTISGASISGVFTVPENQLAGIPAVAVLHEDFNVFYLDLLIGQSLFEYSYFRMLFQAGLQYGYVNFVEQATFSSDIIDPGVRIVQSNSKFSGAGPQIGVDFCYDMCRWLCITGRGSAAFLAAKREVTFFDNGTIIFGENVQSTNSDYWGLIPMTDLRLGLCIRAPCDFRRWFDCSPMASLGCLKLDLEIGYEVILFYKAIDRVFFVDDISIGSSTDELMDLTFHGPYVRLGLAF